MNVRNISIALSGCLICMLLLQVDSYNVLLAFPMASKSLHNLFSSIGENLANANNKVTLLTSYKPSLSHPNIRHVNALGDKPLPVDNIFELKAMSDAMECFKKNCLYIGEKMWTNSAVWEIWMIRNSFDAILIPSYLNEITMPFLLSYNGRFMVVSTPGVEYFAVAASGNWLPASVVPAIFLPYDEYMTFFERCINFVTLFVMRYYSPRLLFPEQEKLLQRYFPDIGDFFDYYDRSVLTLINGHPALDSPVPLLPNQVEIGTINANLPRPLPQDLEEFVSSSGSAGVIYFSIGSIALSKDIPSRAKEEFVKAFRRLPQKVVWKYEGTDLNLPPNVIARPWLPQQDLLGHPKTRLFISHCGNLGTQEAKYHGVPVLAVPVAFDQPRNAARMVRKGYALSLDWDTLTEDSIVEAVNQLINDTTYSERLLAVSEILKDQKESPGERAVWWIEHVIRHKGAPYLQYPGKRFYFLQYISADVILFFALLIFAFWRLLKYVFTRSTRTVTCKAKKRKKQ